MIVVLMVNIDRSQLPTQTQSSLLISTLHNTHSPTYSHSLTIVLLLPLCMPSMDRNWEENQLTHFVLTPLKQVNWETLHSYRWSCAIQCLYLHFQLMNDLTWFCWASKVTSIGFINSMIQPLKHCITDSLYTIAT